MTEPDSPVAVLAALGDPTRWQVLSLLAEQPASASALARELPVSRVAIIKHLAILERHQLVRRYRVGREVRFGARLERIQEIARWMSTAAAAWDTRLAALQALAADDQADE